MVYLFIGQDAGAKDIALDALKKQFLPTGLREFNIDLLFSRDVQLPALQERILSLPVNSEKRLIIIKDASVLHASVKEWLQAYVLKPHPSVVLVLDFLHDDAKDNFLETLKASTRNVQRFKEETKVDVFGLHRQIRARKPQQALQVLNALCDRGERPEMIIGGLRYCCESDFPSAAAGGNKKQQLALLLLCDVDIKTGRFQPRVALEKLVVTLCQQR